MEVIWVEGRWKASILGENCEHCGANVEDGCDCREGIEEFYNAFYSF